MPTDYIPHSDAEFNSWLAGFALYAGDNHVALGLTTAQIDDLNTAVNAWNIAYTASLAAQAAAGAAVQTKNVSLAAVVALVRVLTGLIQANPAVTDAQRASLGITVPGSAPPMPDVPTTRPIGSVDFGQMRTHIINFVDETTQSSKAKPAGVQGCEVWAKLGGPAPTSDADFDYIATDTRAPYVAHYEMGDIGKTVYYHLRWATAHGERGPWSVTFSALIGG